jgi:hypothetical protein
MTSTADLPRLGTPTPSPGDLSTDGRTAGGDARPQKHVHLWDRDQAAQEIAGSDVFEERVLHIVGNNPTTIQQRWNR